MGFTTDNSAIKGKVLDSNGIEIEFEDMKKEDIVTFPGDIEFTDKYLVDIPPYFSLDRPAGTYEVRLIQIT
jgi:hypothetical protein